MSSTIRAARKAGLLYFVFAVFGVIREFVLPDVLVRGDAAATARNLLAGEPTYRLTVLAGMLTLVLFVYLVASLHRLFRGVDETQSLRMVLLVAVGVTISFANVLNEFVPLLLLKGADYLSVFTREQLEALSLTALRLHGTGGTIASVFWGLWLFPFGTLVIKSGYFPRAFGVLLWIAGAAYVATSVTTIAFPDYRAMVNRVAFPLYFGELPIIFALLHGGTRRPVERPA